MAKSNTCILYLRDISGKKDNIGLRSIHSNFILSIFIENVIMVVDVKTGKCVP